jgi:hypothetical protein
MMLLLFKSDGHSRGIRVLVLAAGVVGEGLVVLAPLGEVDGLAVELIIFETIISSDEEAPVDCSVVGEFAVGVDCVDVVGEVAVGVGCVDVVGLPVAVAQLH